MLDRKEQIFCLFDCFYSKVKKKKNATYICISVVAELTEPPSSAKPVPVPEGPLPGERGTHQVAQAVGVQDESSEQTKTRVHPRPGSAHQKAGGHLIMVQLHVVE